MNMKKTRFTKLLSAILVAVLLLSTFASVLAFAEDASAGVVADEAVKSVSIISKNLNYASRTEIVYAVEAVGVEEDDSVVMLFWDGEQTEYTYENALYRKSFYGKDTVQGVEGCYLFATRGIAPKNINDSIYARPVVRHIDVVDGEVAISYTYGDVVEYNVGMYAAEKLAEAYNTSAQNDLYEGLLQYADAAGAMFGAAEPNYVLAKVVDDAASFGGFGVKYATPDKNGKILLRAEAVNGDGLYFIKWVDADGKDVSASRVAKVTAPTEAGLHVYTPVYGEAADSAYANTLLFEDFATGLVNVGDPNYASDPTTACYAQYSGSNMKRWNFAKTINNVKFTQNVQPAYTAYDAETKTYTFEKNANGYYVPGARDNYYITESASGDKEIYIDRDTNVGSGWTIGFNPLQSDKSTIMYAEVDFTFESMSTDQVQLHFNVSIKDKNGLDLSLRTNLFTRRYVAKEDGTTEEVYNGYIYAEGKRDVWASVDGVPSYFSCHDGETNTLGIRLVIRDGAAYLEYYFNGEYAGELAVASFDKYKNTLDLDSAYLGYLSANTVTANCDDIIIDNVSFSK